ncbi:hypothetical protein E0Z10_g9980 [Xylaria hypoxylon]|uniref:Uncharacterized protein n=1 Tax=Xylaria hypoxylon TaxID=37992 RepID=A0A4Z0YJC5_9PEZI|nr:hypothetical protein E0Z10_g9980 [Xylaria hypoxylon]
MSRLQGRYSKGQDQILDINEARYGGEGFGYHSQSHYAASPQNFQHDYENTTVSMSSKRQYKPTALRWPFLLALLLALLTTLAFLSYAVASLPVWICKFTHLLLRKGLEGRIPRLTTACHEILLLYSTTYPATRDVGDGAITESSTPVSTPTTTPSSSDETPTIFSTKDESDYGRIGTRTVSVSDISTASEVKDPSDSAITPTVAATKPQTDYGGIGTKTITEALPYETTSATDPYSTNAEGEFGEIGSKTISDQPASSTAQIGALTHVTLGVTTITDAEGSPIATSTETPSLVTSLQTSTLTNSEGHATATQLATLTVTPSVSVKTDSLGHPTATVVSYPITPSANTAVYVTDGGHYFMGAFLPTLVSTILAIAVRILDTNAKSFQPWHVLTHERGALGRDSLCLETSGWRSLVMSLHSLVGGQAVVFLTSFLSLSSAVLISISADTVTLDLRGDGCEVGGSSASNCAYILSVSPAGSKAATGILALMTLATIFLVIVVGRWSLGVYTNPWSMCTLASLSANPDVQRLVLDAATGADAKQVKSQLKHQDFKLDHFRDAKGNMEYGIVALDRFSGTGLSLTYESERVPLASSGVLILVLYYAKTGGDTAFERFIDSDTFGVRILFSSLGVIISLFWSSFLSAVAIMTSYQMLAERPQEASQSILLAPPTNAFSGLWHAARTRRAFLGIVSLASIFSLSLSIFLSNIPFKVTQTFFVVELCIWTAVGIMSFMVLIILSSFFVKWPHMPVDPSTIAGAMYYICDTSVVGRFEGLSTLDKKERDRTVTNMALLYKFGETTSASGGSRIGLDVLDSGDSYTR